MLNFPLWKKLFVLAVLLLGTASVIPNFLTQEQRDNLPAFMPNTTITLGLDLQGGSHLVLEVDTDAVFERAYDNLADEIRLTLRKEKDAADKRLRYRGLKANGTKNVTFVLPDDSQKDVIGKLLRTDLRETEVEYVDNRYVVTLNELRLAELKARAMEQTLEILRNRVDEFGVAEPIVHRQGEQRIVIELPGIDDVERAKGIIGRTAQLTFHMVDDTVSATGRAPAGKVIKYENVPDPINGGVQRIPYVLNKRPEISGENLADAYSGFDQYSRPAIFIRFDGVGTKKFAKLTTNNTGRRMAIVLDGIVYSAPSLNEPILGGSAQITGDFSVPEADDLATVLRAGALPAPVKIVEERTVGPSLGADSVAAGKLAIMIGFAMVLAVMLAFYRGFGVAANMALLFNVLLIMGIMSFLQATLTLPGIAGIVLTIGMAVDANVLIFERIREETRKGKRPRVAMDNGFQSAFGTILDANITTFIAAIVLFAIGSGPIKGFALTLSVGIATSMFTAIMLTRMILVTWVLAKKPKKIAV